GTVGGLEFGHGPADVCLGGGGADHHPGGDLVVGQAAGGQGDDLAFAVGERVESGHDAGVGWSGQVLADQAAGDRGGKQGVASGGEPYPGQEVGRFGVFDEEPAGSGAQRGVDMLVDAVVGEDDHVDAGQSGVGGDLAGCLDTVEDGHLDVDEGDIG